MARRPWYGFVYYVLGTRGSFFAWVVALLGVYVTWREAVLYTLNQGPRPARVAELKFGNGELGGTEPAWRRWVQVGGVEIDLAKLFAIQDRSSEVYEDRILIDRDDPAAVAWREVFREIQEARSAIEPAPAGSPQPGGSGGVLPGRSPAAPPSDEEDAKLKRLGTLLIEIGTLEIGAPLSGSGGRRLVPAKALVVIASAGAASPTDATRTAHGALSREGREGVSPSRAGALSQEGREGGAGSGGPGPGSGGAGAGAGGAAGSSPPEDLLTRWRRTTLARIDLVRAAVRIDVEREGLLVQLPESQRGRFRDAYGVEVARAALGMGQRPSALLAGICGGFVLLLVFLAVGLRAGPANPPG